MKVKELIQQLVALDPETEVFTSGYEGGYHIGELDPDGPQDFLLDCHTEWYYGKHEKVNNLVSTYSYEDKKTVKGILIH
jgi:hypothetical protein